MARCIRLLDTCKSYNVLSDSYIMDWTWETSMEFHRLLEILLQLRNTFNNQYAFHNTLHYGRAYIKQLTYTIVLINDCNITY